MKLPSDSSASRIDQSLLPNFAVLLIEFITPPLIIVGSIFVVWKIDVINEVVVVFPCEPTTTIFFIRDTICANILPLLIIGKFFLFASIISGLFFFIAEDTTTIVASLRFCFFCPIKILIFSFLSLSTFLFRLKSLPWTLKPLPFIIKESPLIPIPPIPTKWIISVFAISIFIYNF